jgi:hypothetical protein
MGGRRWNLEAAGVPCTIEKGKAGEWVVTLASTTLGRDVSLVTAIVRAGGGLVSPSEAETVAASVERAQLSIEASQFPPDPVQAPDSHD